MTTSFGERVVGKAAHEEAVAKSQTGAAAFGPRVIDGIPGSANSSFGVRVTADEPTKGRASTKGTTEISIDELERVLDENPTFFDSLYRGELERPGGPRKAALEVFDLVEMGPKGAGRAQIHDTIGQLLGRTDATIKEHEKAREAAKVQIEEQEARAAENILLQDAPRLAALRQREDDLAAVRAGGSKSGKSQLVSDNTDSQIRAISERSAPKSGAKRGSKAKSARKSGSASRKGKAAKRRPAGQRSASYQAPVASGSDAK